MNPILAIILAAMIQTPEQEVLAELNLARTQPMKYAALVAKHRTRFIDDKSFTFGNVKVTTQEGLSAVDEAILFLKKAKPRGKLTMSKGISLAAKDHAVDKGKSGKTGHKGTDGSSSGMRMNRYGKWRLMCGEAISFGPVSARDIVMSLIIDDGVADRGHRENIFSHGFNYAGIATGKHSKYGWICVIDFAGGYEEKK